MRLSNMSVQQLRDYIGTRHARFGSHKCCICRTDCPPFAANAADSHKPWVCSSCEWNFVYAGGSIQTLRAAWR